MNIKLGCIGYDVRRAAAKPVTITANLILKNVSPHNVEDVAEALKRIELFLGNELNLVKATDRPRCYYCGSLNDDGEKHCTQCNAPL